MHLDSNTRSGDLYPPGMRGSERTSSFRRAEKFVRSVGFWHLMLLLPGLLAGCHNAEVGHPLTEKLSGNDMDSQMEFWHTLAERHVTSNDEAFHGLLLYFDGNDTAADYPQRVSILKGRGMLRGDFSAPAHQAIDRGTLAVAMVKAMHIKGGLMLHAFNSSPRYAVRELVYLDLYPPSSPNQTFSGGEFLGIIGKMEDYQRNAAPEHSAG